MSVTNIYNTTSMTSFSFSLTNFLNPPTTQPTNNFIFQTYNSTSSSGVVIDESSNNLVAGVTPSSILNPRMYLSEYALGLTVEANITVTITNVLSTTDTIFIAAPS